MKTQMRQGIRYIVTCFCLLVVLFSACGSRGSSGIKAPDDQQQMRYPVIGDVATIDPALAQDVDSNVPIETLFTGLVSLDGNLNIKMQMAESYQLSDDNMTYTFKLRPNLKFSDGSPLTARDIVYSMNRVVLPATHSPVSYYLSLVKNFDKVNKGEQPSLIGDSLLTPDDTTVIIKISKPAAYFLQTLAYPTSNVVKQALVEKYQHGNSPWTDHVEEGGSSGPFKMISYSHSKGIRLERNDNYYGPKPQLKYLTIPFYQDGDSMYKAYQANQLEYTTVPTLNVPGERHNASFQNINMLSIRYISMNYKARPFDNMKIRQAFALAVNKDQIVKGALKGVFIPTNHIVPSGMPGYYSDLKGPDGTAAIKGNHQLARKLLQEGMKEASYSKLPPITLTYYPQTQDYKNAMDQLVAQWNDVLGIKVASNTVSRATLQSLENATLNQSGPLQIWQATWNADYPDPQDWLSVFFGKGSDYNQFNYGQNDSPAAAQQQSIQQQLAEADTMPDATHRMALYNKAEQGIVNDIGWLSLWQETLPILVQPYIHNFHINALQQVPPDSWGEIYVTV